MSPRKLTLQELADEVIETDVLIIGGGLAGCQAAISTKDNKNIDVTIVEKAAIRRSGECGAGMDHNATIAHPRINDLVVEEFGRIRATELGGLASAKLSIATAKYGIKVVELLEDLGVKVREEDGTYRFIPGRSPKGDFILYRGADLKLKQAAEVYKRGVRVFNRTMCTSLITKGDAVVGATAVNVRNGKFFVFKAKLTLLSTGGIQRLYGYPFATFPNNLFMAYQVATNAGDGAALAYRAGAKLTNMEFTYDHMALAGWPQAAIARHAVGIKNSKGEILDEKYGKQRRERYGLGGIYTWTDLAYMPNMQVPEAMRDVLYFDTTEAPDEAETYGLFMSANETPMGVKIIRDRGGLKTAPFEMRDWISGLFRSFCGVMFDEEGETSLKGLFIAGDVAGGLPGYGAPGAQIWGYKFSKYAREYTPNTEKPSFGEEQIRQVQVQRERIRALVERKDGVNPLELEDYVRKVMQYYVQLFKIEPKLKRALELVRLVRERFVPALAASSPHELMRALEVQYIIDIAEMHAYSALLRTETRMPPYHYRLDYPEQDDVNWKKNIVVQSKDGKIKHSFEVLE